MEAAITLHLAKWIRIAAIAAIVIQVSAIMLIPLAVVSAELAMRGLVIMQTIAAAIPVRSARHRAFAIRLAMMGIIGLTMIFAPQTYVQAP